jgi:hypothetical protein
MMRRGRRRRKDSGEGADAVGRAASSSSSSSAGASDEEEEEEEEETAMTGASIPLQRANSSSSSASMSSDHNVIGVLVTPGGGQSFLHSLRVRSGMTAKEARGKLGARLRLLPADLSHYGLIRVDGDGGELLKLKTLADGEQISPRTSRRWFFKDSRTTPLEFGEGELSGEESSEGEGAVSVDWSALHDVWSAGPASLTGWLMKRSSNDPNLWRRRWCVLTVRELAALILSRSISPTETGCVLQADKLWILKRRLTSYADIASGVEESASDDKRRPLWLPLAGNTVRDCDAELKRVGRMRANLLPTQCAILVNVHPGLPQAFV